MSDSRVAKNPTAPRPGSGTRYRLPCLDHRLSCGVGWIKSCCRAPPEQCFAAAEGIHERITASMHYDPSAALGSTATRKKALFVLTAPTLAILICPTAVKAGN
jgi:hypothetical protein